MKLITEGFKVLSPKEMAEIIEAAARVAIKVGMKIDGTEEFFAYLEKFGCDITKERIYFPEEVIENVLKTAKNEKEKKEFQPLSSEIKYSASGQALLCLDAENDST